jgi:hypothetical protein
VKVILEFLGVSLLVVGRLGTDENVYSLCTVSAPPLAAYACGLRLLLLRLRP